MPSEIWKPNVTVAAIAEKNGQFLMVEENINQRIVYNQPAGHLDEGEGLIDAVIRETLEETAYHFQPQAIVAINRWQTPDQTTYLRFCFCGVCTQHEAQRKLDKEIIQAFWIKHKDLSAQSEKLRSPMVMHCIDRYLAGIRYDLEILQDLCLIQ